MLTFHFGTMYAGKTENLISMFRSNPENTAVSKFIFDWDWQGRKQVKSRNGESLFIDFPTHKDTNFLKVSALKWVRILLIDEVQFLTKEQVMQLWILATSRNPIQIHCFGLLFGTNQQFEASKLLLERAHTLVPYESDCAVPTCENQAVFSARFRKINGKFVKTEEDIDEPSITYFQLCGACSVKRNLVLPEL